MAQCALMFTSLCDVEAVDPCSQGCIMTAPPTLPLAPPPTLLHRGRVNWKQSLKSVCVSYVGNLAGVAQAPCPSLLVHLQCPRAKRHRCARGSSCPAPTYSLHPPPRPHQSRRLHRLRILPAAPSGAEHGGAGARVRHRHRGEEGAPHPLGCPAAARCVGSPGALSARVELLCACMP